jgi:UDP-N-acetyl-D-galactosamine dehydrogenase
VIDIVSELKDYNCEVDVYDPWVSTEESTYEYGITPIISPKNNNYDAVIIAVAHQQFKDMGAENIQGFKKSCGIIFDLKYVLQVNQSDLRL